MTRTQRTDRPRASLVLALGGASLFLLGSCSDDDSNPEANLRVVHQFLYDDATGQYSLPFKTVSSNDVKRDLVGSLCAECHAAQVAELKDSVHYKIAAPTDRVLFPGGGAHGMLDRACGLPSTTGLTNYLSDINLGECAKCHVGRYMPAMEGFFGVMFQQMGVSDPSGEATRLIDAGLDCLVCHAENYRSVPKDGILAAVAGTADPDGSSPTAVGAARASRDNADFDHDGQLDLVIDMDGDGTPDAPLMFDSDGDGTPDTPWPTVAQDRSVEAIASIGPTTEHTCLRCHEHARTGYKRGTLFVEGHDLHATLDTGVFEGAENQCTVCHDVDSHKYVRGHMVGGDLAAADYRPPPPGTAPNPNDPTDLRCETCHEPQQSQIHSSSHLDKISCETCHIPWGSGITYSLFGHGGQVSFARNAAGKDTRLVVADMYLAGDKQDLDNDFEAYKVSPILMWFNGGTSFLAQSLAVRGMPNTKITPFKPMANGMIFDARYFSGLTETNAAGVDYNAHSMYRFFANGTNAEAFSALGMIDMTPDRVRRMSLADFQNPDPTIQTMAMMMVFPNLVYFDKARYGYEHYLTPVGSPFDSNGDGIIDAGQPFNFDMLEAANSGLRQFAGFNGPMGFPPEYQWYPPFQDVSDVISMKLPDGSLMKMFLQMQANQLPEPQRSEMLAAIANYPSYSQITLGGHGVMSKENALGAGNNCIQCHGSDSVLTRPMPVGRKVPTNMGPMGTIELPVYGWKFYNVHALVDLGLSVSCEDIVSGGADIDIDGDTTYLRESTGSFVVNWLAPDMAGGYFRPDSSESLAGTNLTAADLTWNGGSWMPALEPVTDPVPQWQVLGLPATVIWP